MVLLDVSLMNIAPLSILVAAAFVVLGAVSALVLPRIAQNRS
jgi:hypothetical protein